MAALICPNCGDKYSLHCGSQLYDDKYCEFFYPVYCTKCKWMGKQVWEYTGFEETWDKEFDEYFDELRESFE